MPETPEPKAVRLIFEMQGDDIRLVHQQPVDVLISGFDLPPEHLPGHFVEVRGSDEQVLSRVPVRAGMSTSLEVFPEDPKDPITRTEAPDLRRSFTVVVPRHPRAVDVALIHTEAAPPAAEDAAAAAPAPPARTVLATFPLEGGAQ